MKQLMLRVVTLPATREVEYFIPRTSRTSSSYVLLESSRYEKDHPEPSIDDIETIPQKAHFSS